MKVYIVFKDGKPFNICFDTDKKEVKEYEDFLRKTYKDHLWEIKKCELKVI